MYFNYVFMPIIIFVAGVFLIWLSSRRILVLSKKTYPASRKIVERAVLSIVILVAVTIAGYTALNAIAVHSFWARNPAPGRVLLSEACAGKADRRIADSFFDRP